MKTGFDLKLRGTMAGIRYPAIADIKYDGELALVSGDGNSGWATGNKYGRMRKFTCDEIGLKDEKFGTSVYLAELMYKEGRSGDLYQLLSHKEDTAVLRVRIFDVFYHGNVAMHLQPLVKRKEILKQLDPKVVAESAIVRNKQDIDDYMSYAVDEGYEGIVVKNADETIGGSDQLIMAWVKIKHKDTSVFIVSRVDPVKERIEVTYPYFNKVGDQCVGCSGVKVMHKHKKTLMPGDHVNIEHQGILDTGGLRHPVFLRKVVE
jgi:hypothetical protein